MIVDLLYTRSGTMTEKSTRSYQSSYLPSTLSLAISSTCSFSAESTDIEKFIASSPEHLRIAAYIRRAPSLDSMETYGKVYFDHSLSSSGYIIAMRVKRH